MWRRVIALTFVRYPKSQMSFSTRRYNDCLVVFGLTALCDSISVCIGPSPKEREKEERKDR